MGCCNDTKHVLDPLFCSIIGEHVPFPEELLGSVDGHVHGCCKVLDAAKGYAGERI